MPPYLVIAVTLALFHKFKGTEHDRFLGALEYARSSLIQKGHLVASSDRVPLKMVRLTGRGMEQERLHKKDPNKLGLFQSLYQKYRKGISTEPQEETSAADPKDS